MTSATIRLLPK